MQFPTRTLLAMALTVSAGHATAEDLSGYYAKVYGGLSTLQGDTFVLGGTSSTLSYDGSTLVGGAVGYDYAGSPLRAEVEYTYRSGDLDDFPVGLGSSGDYASTSIMVNGYYMFDTANARLKPYVGLGIGFATETDFDIEGGSVAGEYSESGSFAYQAMLGVEYSVSPRVSLFGEARYFSAGTPDLAGPGGALLQADYDTFDVLAGLSYRF